MPEGADGIRELVQVQLFLPCESLHPVSPSVHEVLVDECITDDGERNGTEAQQEHPGMKIDGREWDTE